MIKKISVWLTRKPKLVILVALLALIPSLLGAAATRINYDILSYLPPDSEASRGEALLEEPFQDAATTMLVVEDMPPAYCNQLLLDIQKIQGVTNATWLSNLVGIQIPTDMIPANLRDVFYSGDATMMIIQYDSPGASQRTMQAIDQVRTACNKNCFLAGFSVIIRDTRSLVDKELPLYIVMAVVLSLVAMAFTIDSWVLPLAFLISIGLAILYNFGTNFFLGQISYITKAIAAVLQLGVTMDYSIFLYRRYEEEKPKYDDPRDAMSQAIQAAFTSLSGSSLTTIAGFLALCAMRLLLGRDIGIVMAKGVVLGVATVILVLPSILLVLDKLIQKTHHRTLMPNFTRVNRFVIRNRKKFAVLFLLLYVPAVYSQANTAVYYKLDRSLPQTMDSIVATNKLKDEFNMASSHFVVMRDDLSNAQLNEMTDRLEAVDGVETVLSYNKLVNDAIPDFFIPDEIKDLFKEDGMQLVMINSSYTTASQQVSQQLDEVREIIKSYDPSACVTGEAAMTQDLIDTARVDFKMTSYISIAAIFLIVAVVFQSISMPIVLVAAIELAIFINQGIPYFTGSVIPFITPTFIGCVQLGATVDYAILMATRFREELRSGKGREEAMLIAATASDSSILTSSLVLFCATLGVSAISKIEIISNICVTLARGALVSAVVSIFIMPAVLCLCEPIIARTSRHWRTVPMKKEKPEPSLPAAK
ncbi:MAG: MMPL family transporter [Intestinimonas sp.]|nr:MMPL family transporter [Intestinimonas sp.]